MSRGLAHHPSRHRHVDGETTTAEKREVGAAILLGPTRAHVLAILLLGKLHSLGYSRDVESRADLTGFDLWAATGYNRWGLVWLFQDFKNAQIGQIPQFLSDHPDDQNRSKRACVDSSSLHSLRMRSAFDKIVRARQFSPNLGPIWVW